MQSNTPEIPTSVSENPFALVEQAATQYKQKNFETALDLLVRAEILARKTKRPEALVVIFSMAGNVFTGMEEFEKALRYFEKSLEIINMFETVEEKEAEKEAEAGKEAGKEREAEKEREENKEEKNEETGAGFDCEKEAEESEPESIFIEWSASNEGKIG
ncbi:MAG: tetratricopeptide repeat protein, partial [Methanosarcinaceae archaeon]|nr:tetratricopeptide repeat protein [Methanosarcinaceae archaeon]